MPSAGPGRAEWRDGFSTVATSFFGLAVAVLATWSIGLFMEPIGKETGWGRGQINSALLVHSVVGFFGAPFVGRLIDRVGVRKVGLIGMILYCSGLAMLGLTGPMLWQWWALWLLLAAGYILINPTLWAVAVAQRFDTQRGLALGLSMCGSGAVLVVIPSVMIALLSRYGWRASYVFLGAGSAVVTLPLIVLFLRDRVPVATLAAPSTPEPTAEDDPADRTELAAALRSPRFIRILLAAVLMTFPLIGLHVHFVPLMIQHGIDRTTVAIIAGLIGIGSITGRLASGFLLDRTRGQILGAIVFLLPACSSILLLNYHGNIAMGCVIALIQGLALGAELDIFTFLVSRYYGMRNYGTMIGTLVGLLVVGAGVGPTVAGWVFDVTGDYTLFIAAAIPSFISSALLVASLGDYPRHGRLIPQAST